MRVFAMLKTIKVTVMTCIRHYLSDTLSYSDISEIMAGRGISISLSTIYRWVIKIVPSLEKTVRRYKRKVDHSWKLDETYVKIQHALLTSGTTLQPDRKTGF